MAEPVDERADLPVVDRRLIHEGRVITLVAETVDLGDGGIVTRELTEHPGAVAIVALDDEDRVLMIRQYRHPVGSYLWEVPAGLLDVDGESLVDSARRELAEEADATADRWHTLIDYYTTPGSSTEAVRVFLARGLGEVPESDRHERFEEELGMQVLRIPLERAVAHVLAGDVHNPSAVAGILAAHAARADGWRSLRPADAPWVR